MIARIWRGATTAAHADAYLDYLRRTSLAACKSSGDAVIS